MANMAKIDELLSDIQVMGDLRQCETEEEVMALLNSKGAEVTADEAKIVMSSLQEANQSGDEAMDLDEMDAVAGGIFDNVKSFWHQRTDGELLEDGTRIWSDGTKLLPNGIKINPDGSQLMPDGTLIESVTKTKDGNTIISYSKDGWHVTTGSF